MTTGGVMEGIMNSTNMEGVRRGIFPSKHNSLTTTGGVMEGNLNSVNLGGVRKEKLNSGINESDLGGENEAKSQGELNENLSDLMAGMEERDCT
jgi:hypothetical protein